MQNQENRYREEVAKGQSYMLILGVVLMLGTAFAQLIL